MAHISPLFEDDQPSATDIDQADVAISGSELSPVLAPSVPSPLFNPVLAAEINRTSGKQPVVAKQTGIPDAPLLSTKALAPLSAGLGAGQGVGAVDTPSAAEAGVSIGASVIGGVVSGALVGGAAGGVGAVPGAIIGGISALVISGTKAWFGVRNARRRNRALKELQRKAERQRLADIARDEKWRRINQFNTVQQAAANRNQVELQNKWSIYQNVAQSMTNLMNSDANLNQIMRNNMQGVT